MAIWTTLIVVIVVGLAGPLLALWAIVKNTEKAERDPRYRRRVLLLAAAGYTLAFIYGIVDALGQAVRHQLEWPSLTGLGVVAVMAALFFKSALARPPQS